MGVFDRVINIIKSSVNDVLDQIEEPENAITHYFNEVEKELERGYTSLAHDLLREKRLEFQISESEKFVQKRARQAKLAIERQEEEIAKLAIEEKLLHEKNLRIYQDQYLEVKSKTNKLYNQLENLKRQYHELHSSRLYLLPHPNQEMNTNMESRLGDTEQILETLKRTENLLLKLEEKYKPILPNGSFKQTLPSSVSFKEEVEKEWLKMKEERE